MKREEKMNGLATELLNEAAKDQSKKHGTIILSTFDTGEDNTGCITAACGSVVGMASVLSITMMKNEHLKAAIMMAADMNQMFDDANISSSPLALAALLGGALGKL